jgi:serine/threonine protein kinase
MSDSEINRSPDHHREESLFAAALAKAPEERARFLDGACHGDRPLRARLEALLASHEALDQPLAPLSSLTKATVQSAPSYPDEDATGQTIGRYKLLERLGEGGCGVVYVAEQTEPLRRRVALKVIKLGMDTKQVVARFEAERQALAMMDHPNIAKVLDAGTIQMQSGEGRMQNSSADSALATRHSPLSPGRPYFVMELVRGIRITDYCDQAQLSTQDRLNLFIKVCQAIQHAHQKGVIHRDIKPSNILVTLHDGVPVPKVIDFGIAKATEGRLTDATVYTQLHQFIGTPAYMSPEQAEMSGLDIDTRSDIYSLGVLLYELLAGSTPFDAKQLVASGIDTMRKTIREKEPMKPSTRLATLQGEELTTTAKRRSVESTKLMNQLRGDLDWIVMKCLEKDRQRRYETANELANDLERHLSCEPIVARPPSVGYRFQKLVRRNKVGVAAVAMTTLALLTGLVLSLWQSAQKSKAYKQAQTAESLANERLEEAEIVSKFLSELLSSPDPSRDGHTVTVAELLRRAAEKLENDLSAHPARRAKLQWTIALTYVSLGLHREAVPLAERIVEYRRAALGREHSETLVAMNLLGLCFHHGDRRPEALKLQEEVVALCQRTKGPEDRLTLMFQGNLASFHLDEGRYLEAIRIYEKLLPLCERLQGPTGEETMRVKHNLAMCYDDASRIEEAIALQEEVLLHQKRIKGPEHPETIGAMQNLAFSYSHSNPAHKSRALKLREEVMSLSRKVFGPNHPAMHNAIQNMVDSYVDFGKYDDAERLLTEGMEWVRKDNTNSPRSVTYYLTELADLRHRYQKQYPAAYALYQELLQDRRRRFSPGHSEYEDKINKPSGGLAALLADWAWVERTNITARARAYEAERLMREALAVRLTRTNATAWKTGEWKSRLGSAFLSVAVTDSDLTLEARESKFAEAEKLLLQGNQAVQESTAADRRTKAETLERLVRLYESWGQPERAAPFRTKLKDFEPPPYPEPSVSAVEAAP